MMATQLQYLVNAFAEDGFEGNPAAVCIVDRWPSDAEMQCIAKENNLSETAFCLCLRDDKLHPEFHIRWFTPGCEVDLCGHATLATSYILFKHYFKEAEALHFQSRSGDLHVRKTDDFIILMDFPSYTMDKVTEASEIQTVAEVLGNDSFELYRGIDYVAVLEEEKDVLAFKPDFHRIASLPGSYNLLITTASSNGKYDFVSRCFFPKEAIDEDPVTGSAHCTLGPFWARRMNKISLNAYQASLRGGILHLKIKEGRVIVGGRAVIVEDDGQGCSSSIAES
ncbi:MAG: PhzF family phenazine biosynthesis protein [Bacteroidales bacterium]|nr:PhzF family phenazine biosynthesis protein [Bacteroidales bacterium]